MTSRPQRVWLEAARPRTLPAAVAPVLVGTAAAERFVAWRFAAALVVALAVQVAVNFANDYYDGVAGVDTSDRVGPRRAVGSGLVAADRMRAAMLAAFAVAALAGGALALAVGWELVLVGLVCFVAAVGYSGGPRPYASAGLGEVFVFVFFGLVATAGSAYVQDEALRLLPLVVAIPVGLLATAILVANNLRDIPTDTAAAKRTLAVRMGDARTRTLHAVLVVGAYVLLVPVALVARSPWPLLGWAAAPLAAGAVRTVRRARSGPEHVRALVTTARLELATGALVALGLVLT